MIAPFEIVLPDLAEPVAGLVRFLSARCGPGDRIAVLAGNSPDFVIARLAVTTANLTLVPINPKLTAPEIGYVLDHSGARLLLSTDALHDTAHRAAADASVELAPIASRADGPPVAISDAIGATLIYTSGTTGYPKGCMRSDAQETARADELAATYGLTDDDVHLIACPLAHSAPGIFLRAGLRAGARTFVLPRFRPEPFLAAVEACRASFFFLVPTQYERLLALPREARARYDTSSIRCAIVAGAPIAPATVERLVDWLGDGVLWEFYGSSETGTVAVLPPADQLTRPGSVGLPPPGVEIRIVDTNGRDVGPDQVGEIYVRSPTLMSGYLDGDTGELHHPSERGGFVSVGDLGRRDADGYLYLVDRKHDTIISGGVNVYPAEVERALAEHPEVRGAVVFGVADDDWGQIVAAVVAPAAPPADRDSFARELRTYLRAQLAAFKIPKAIAVIDPEELPIGSSGKPLRRRARAEHAGKLLRYDA